MKFLIKRIHAGDYDQHHKRIFYVDVEFSFKYLCESAVVYKTLEFYDEENLEFNKDDFDHFKNFVIPLIHEKTVDTHTELINELVSQCNELKSQQTNGQ